MQPIRQHLLALEQQFQKQYRNSDWVEAINTLQQILEIKKENIGDDNEQYYKTADKICELCNLVAMILLQKQQFESSLAYLKRAQILSQATYHNRAVTYNNFACFYRRTGKTRTALTFLQKALELENQTENTTTLSDTHLNLCAVLSQLDKHQEAFEHVLLSVVHLQDDYIRSLNQTIKNLKQPLFSTNNMQNFYVKPSATGSDNLNTMYSAFQNNKDILKRSVIVTNENNNNNNISNGLNILNSKNTPLNSNNNNSNTSKPQLQNVTGTAGNQQVANQSPNMNQMNLDQDFQPSSSGTTIIQTNNDNNSCPPAPKAPNYVKMRENIKSAQTTINDVQNKRVQEERAAVLAIAYHNMGVQLEFLQRFEEAIHTYTKAVKFAKENLNADNQLIENLTQVLQTAQNNMELHMRKGGNWGDGAINKKHLQMQLIQKQRESLIQRPYTNNNAYHPLQGNRNHHPYSSIQVQSRTTKSNQINMNFQQNFAANNQMSSNHNQNNNMNLTYSNSPFLGSRNTKQRGIDRDRGISCEESNTDYSNNQSPVHFDRANNNSHLDSVNRSSTIDNSPRGNNLETYGKRLPVIQNQLNSTKLERQQIKGGSSQIKYNSQINYSNYVNVPQYNSLHVSSHNPYPISQSLYPKQNKEINQQAIEVEQQNFNNENSQLN